MDCVEEGRRTPMKSDRHALLTLAPVLSRLIEITDSITRFKLVGSPGAMMKKGTKIKPTRNT